MCWIIHGIEVENSECGNEKGGPKAAFATVLHVAAQSSGTISRATMLMILISGLTAGPAVSL